MLAGRSGGRAPKRVRKPEAPSQEVASPLPCAHWANTFFEVYELQRQIQSRRGWWRHVSVEQPTSVRDGDVVDECKTV
jgi:hypothetical protein